MLLDLITAPDKESWLTIAEVKKHLNIDHSDDDDYLAELIKTAYDVAENTTWRALASQTWDFYMTMFPRGGDGEIILPKPPLVTVDSIKYQDSADGQQTWDSSKYVVDIVREPGRVYLATNESYPSAYLKRKSIVIRFTAGYSEPVNPIKDWMKIYIADSYDVMRQSYFGGGGFREIMTSDRTFKDNLLASYKVSQF